MHLKRWTARIGAWANGMLRDAYVMYLLARDRRVPWMARVVAAGSAGYFISPIDLIPDHIPVIGYLDDAAVLWFGMLFARRLVPAHILREHQVAARRYRPADIGAQLPAWIPGLYDILGYRWRWIILSLFEPDYVSKTAPIIIGGCGRSGTTLLQAILGNHPHISAGPESTVFSKRVTSPAEIDRRFKFEQGRAEQLQRRSRSQAEFIELFQRECLRLDGKIVWAEKTPQNVRRQDFIFRHFPNARFVHVTRDGRDVACSLRQQSWMKLNGADRASAQAFQESLDYWVSEVEAGRRYLADQRYIEIRYVDLVRDTENTLRRLLDFLQIDWSDHIIDPERLQRALVQFEREPREADDGMIHTSSLGRWRRELSREEVRIFKCRAGHLLIELGYEKDYDW
jgi:uncharacterized membrane protein YkvA (DUF1232 family)